MNRKNIPNLTQGAIQTIINNGLYSDTPTLQVLGYKNLSESSAAGPVRYRVLISDGKFSYGFGMLATQLNHLIDDGKMEANTLIKVNKFIVNKVANKTGASAGTEKRIIILLDLDVLVSGAEVGEKIGNPQPLSETGELTKDDSGGTINKPFASNTSNNNNKIPQKPVFAPSKGGYGAEKSDVITHPIVSLTPYQNKWTIKARVTNKTDIRTWSNARGDGKLFSLDLMDESGEIRATAFNAECDKFYHMIEQNKVYYISQANLKTANKQFSSIKNDYEMSFNGGTTVVPCHDDTSSIPQITFNFVAINDISNVEKDAIIDVIGVAKSASDVSTIMSKTTSKELKKREVHLVDSTNTEVTLTLWGKQGEDFDVGSQPIVAVKGARVSDFGGRSLGTISGSSLLINPDMPEAHKLRGWYDNYGSSAQTSSISSGRGAGGSGGSGAYKTFAEAKEQTQHAVEKPEYYSVKAMVSMINKEKALYMACATDDCNKKVVDLNNGLYRCEKCNRESQNFKWRLMLSVNLADATEQCWVTCFQETGETLLGLSADELGRMKDEDADGYQKAFDDATFKCYIFRLRAKMDSYNDEQRLKTNVYEVREINYKDYNERLLKEIKEMEQAGY